MKCCPHAKDDHDWVWRSGKCEVQGCRCQGWGSAADPADQEEKPDMFRMMNAQNVPCAVVNQARQVDIIGPIDGTTLHLMILQLAELTMGEDWYRIEPGLCPVCGSAPTLHAAGFPSPVEPKRWLVRCAQGHTW